MRGVAGDGGNKQLEKKEQGRDDARAATHAPDIAR
jgi:hypothetical protein